jgi:hypothetical protein
MPITLKLVKYVHSSREMKSGGVDKKQVFYAQRKTDACQIGVARTPLLVLAMCNKTLEQRPIR